ncbi:sporulation protein [Brevibacillus sp. SYP-B805]|uniref:YhcN/YlaJ family sporulation lipoprotein n=1 Tax=Brevibacillus sp. SYP-B805 TaxID=1578199 RepID=UPI0013EDE4F0|nr:YhcN/YlaJ family sporulation lipoprotein [Brevibacillus sp. SYP-B805]NGQ96943.1 sporulation protein [Brevibacillus sp. SYP-B805]
MKKSWLIGAIAGLTLMATACANNAAPNYTNRYDGAAVRNQAAPVYPRTGTTGITAYDGYGAAYGTPAYGTTDGALGWNTGRWGAYGTGADNTAFGLNRTDGYYGMTSNNTGFRGLGNFPGFDGTAGTRGRVHGPLSIYRDRGMGTLGTQANPHIGYATVHRNSLRSNAVPNIHVDRDALARAVGNVTASCPGVVTSTVLVTDEEVFVGLHTRGTDSRTAKSQARMNAMSVSPRYYKVYVTDNPQMINEMTRIASQSSRLNANATQEERHIDALIRSFGGLVDGDEMRSKGSNRTTQMGGMTGKGTTGR